MLTQQHVYDLAVLIDGAEGVPPPTTDLEQGLVHSPFPTDWPAVPACSLDETWREGVHPVVDGAWVDADTPLSEPLGEVGVAEAEPQVPADGQRDDLVREAVATEARPNGTALAWVPDLARLVDADLAARDARETLHAARRFLTGTSAASLDPADG